MAPIVPLNCSFFQIKGFPDFCFISLEFETVEFTCHLYSQYLISQNNEFNFCFRVYQAENNRLKREWLENIENAKRSLLNEGLLVRQTTIRVKRKRGNHSGSKYESSNNSAMRTIDETKVSDESAWLNELPAELDDCIAHRDMEQAVNIFIICYLRVIVADFFSLKIVSVFHFSSVD